MDKVTMTTPADYDSDLEIQTAIEQRIQEMEDDSYQFPKRLIKSDYIIVAIVAVLCLTILIAGAAL